MKNNSFLLLVFLIAFHCVNFAQEDNEFSIIKTPEQKEKEAEEKELKFQDFFFKALKERAQENYDKAISALDDCNVIFSDNVAVNFEYAKNYYDLKQYDNALEFVKKTLKQKPKELYVLEMAVKINKNLRNYEDAIAYQKKLAEKNHSQKNTLLYLYVLNNQKDKAREIYKELEKEQLLDNRKDYFKRILFKKENEVIVKNKPKNPNSIAFEKKQFESNKSFKNLKSLLEKEKQLQNYKDLVLDSSEGLSLFPAQPYVYLTNGFALNKQNRFNEALESLENGLDYVLDEDKTLLNKFYTQMTIAYKGLGDTKNANKFSSKIIK
jgi:tetratricopeptide (TPR) repeat protein